MSVHEINEIQINVQKSKKSYHRNSSIVLQFSSVQFAECQYKVKTIVMSARQIGHQRPWSWTRLAQSIQNLWWPHGTSATRGLRGAIRHTSQLSSSVACRRPDCLPGCWTDCQFTHPGTTMPSVKHPSRLHMDNCSPAGVRSTWSRHSIH